MDVVIIIPVSRPEYVDRVFASLELMDCDNERTNLLTYVDGSLTLFQKVRNLTVNSKFNTKLCVYRKRGEPSVSSIHRRRKRIADIHNEMRDLVESSTYVFMTEDDTLLPKHCLKTLLRDFSMRPFAGLVSGVQIGRWGFSYIGGWKVNDVYDTSHIESVERGKGVQEVDCAGFYGCLIRTEVYKKHIFEPFEEILGPDFNFGLWLRKQGLKNFINHNVKCGHMTKKGVINFVNTEVIQIEFDRNKDYKFGWKQTIKKTI